MLAVVCCAAPCVSTVFHQWGKSVKLVPGKFTLTEGHTGEEEGLTHLGNPLATLSDLKDEIPPPEDDDTDGDFRQAHHHSAARSGGAHGHRTKREVMAEVMAVSKAARAQKRMQNEDDENLLEDVDSRFAGIVGVCCCQVVSVFK